jgi:hypothetical protein
MKTLWCWRCKIDVPMLDDNEFEKAKELYSLGFKNAKADRFRPLLEYYKNVTGFEETEAAAIMHHQISQYGPICDSCGKPYRTPIATFCASCGDRKE